MARVDAAGLATGYAAGSASITATLSGVSGNTTLTVRTAPPETPPPAPSLPTGGGGGGGGGGFTNIISVLDSSGRMTQEVIAKGTDMQVSIVLPEDTLPRNKVGGLLSSISIRRLADNEARPISPEYAVPVAWYYDVGPNGATFIPPVTLTFRFDPSLIPEGASAGSLYIATWDPLSENWTRLESTVDLDKKEISTEIDHLSIYTAFAGVRPAAFTLDGLGVSPTAAEEGKEVAVTAKVSNSGDLAASYTARLEVDGAAVLTKEVAVAGGSAATVDFSLTSLGAGRHTISLGGLSGTVEIKAKAAPSPAAESTPPAPPASFSVSALSVTPSQVIAGETATVTARVTNSGGSPGSYMIILKVNGAVRAQQDVSLGPGGSQTVSFPLNITAEGDYAIDIAGNAARLVVTAPAAPPTTEPVDVLPVARHFNWLPVWIIAPIVIISGAVIIIVRRKRAP